MSEYDLERKTNVLEYSLIEYISSNAEFYPIWSKGNHEHLKEAFCVELILDQKDRE